MNAKKIWAWVIDGATYAFSSQYQAVLDWAQANGATAPSSQANKIKEDVLVRGLVTDGIWALSDQIFLLSSNGGSTYSLINLKAPGTRNGSAPVSPTFTAGLGWAGNGSTQYLSTNFAPLTHGVNYTQNDGSVIFYIDTNESASGTKTDFGAGDSGLTKAIYGYVFYTGNIFAGFFNANAGANFTNTSSQGFYHFRRTASNAFELFKDCIRLGGTTTASSGLTASNIFLGAVNNNGTPSGFSTKRFGFWLIGSKLSNLELNVHARFFDFYTTSETVTSPTFSSWEDFSNDKSYFLTGAASLSASVTGTKTLVQRRLTGTSIQGYQGATIAENYYIYGVPSSATSILKIDPTTETYTTFSSLSAGTFKYGGSCYATNGKIYHCPQNARSVMVIDTSNDSVYYFDTTGVVAADNVGTLTGSQKWYGIYQGANGKLYCAPYNATEVMVIDPSNDSISFIDSAGATTFVGGNLSGSQKWDSGVVYGNFIYCAPSDATDFLKINTSANTCARFGSYPAGTAKWSSGCLGPNDYLYIFPYYDNRVIKLNPVDDTSSYLATTIGSIDTNIKIAHSCIMPDGRILATPATIGTTSRSYILDTSTDSLSNIGGHITYGGNTLNIGGTISRDGKVYIMPLLGTSIIVQYYAAKTISLPDNFLFNRHSKSSV